MRDSPRRALQVAPAALLVSMLVVSCGEDEPAGPSTPPASEMGSVEVVTVTTGGSLDGDGYSVSVVGGAAHAIGINATLIVSDVAAGAQSVELTGVADNCTVAGANPRDVTVTAGAIAATQFDVSCATIVETGSVEVATVTTGDDLDPDGYSVSVAGGAAHAIGINATLTVSDVEAGARSVELTGMADNCTVAGANPRDVTVTAGATAATQFDVTCAPTSISGQIVFQSASRGILRMDEDGSDQVPIADAGYDPAISVDGTQIAFFAFVGGDREIHVMNADGSDPARLTTVPGDELDPAWSPDGSKILFATERDGNLEIYVMNADGSGQTNLTNDPADDRYPAWSPDGSRIAFARSGDVYLMDADGSAPTRLTDGSAPAWSPDGSRIAFQFALDIHVMNADGSGLLNLTNNPAIEDQPCWSPDGTQIAFSADRDGDFEVWVMNADGSAPTNLTNHPDGDLVGSSQCWR